MELYNGIILFSVLIALMLLGTPVAWAMIAVGSTWYVYEAGFFPWFHFISHAPLQCISNYNYSVIPLFFLMGQIAIRTNIAEHLFTFARSWFGGLRGGMGIASIASCAMFGSICGSSLATAATMGPFCLKLMRQSHYPESLACGTLAAGGTLGILIPPSFVLVIYAVLAEQSVGKLFVASLLPALLAIVGYILVIWLYFFINPQKEHKQKEQGTSSKLESAIIVLPIFGVFGFMLTGIYRGWFSPTEGASLVVLVMLVNCFISKQLNMESLRGIAQETAKLTGMVFMIFIGAEVFNAALALSGFPQFLSDYMLSLTSNPWLILTIMVAVLIIIGCIMESVAMILLFVPLFFPILLKLDFGLSHEQLGLWFGVLILILVEVGLITPPVGLNLFVIQSIDPSIKTQSLIKGVTPFIISDAIRILLIIIFPWLTFWFLR